MGGGAITRMVRYGLLMGALTLVLVPAVTLAVMRVVDLGR